MKRLWFARLLALALLGGCGAPGEPRSPEPPSVTRPPEPAAPVAGPGRPAPRVPRSFEHAKRLAWKIYDDHRVTLYCGCAFDPHHEVAAGACGYRARKPGSRARRVEWEHLVPASALGAQRACWSAKTCSDSHGRRFGGRRCCRERDPEFRRMEADLHNLSPEIGELNADRSNYRFGDVPGEARRYGACDFEVDRDAATVEPPPIIRGEIARAYLYMHEVYGPAALPLSPAELARYQAWHRADPPSAWERERDRRIAAIQGLHNPWLER